MNSLKLIYYTAICKVVWWLDRKGLRKDRWHWAEFKRARIQGEKDAKFLSKLKRNWDYE